MAKQWLVLDWPSQSPDVSPTNQVFHFLKTTLMAEKQQELDEDGTSVQASQSITTEVTRCLLMSTVYHSLQSVTEWHEASILVREIKQHDTSAWRPTVKQWSTVWECDA